MQENIKLFVQHDKNTRRKRKALSFRYNETESTGISSIKQIYFVRILFMVKIYTYTCKSNDVFDANDMNCNSVTYFVAEQIERMVDEIHILQRLRHRY